MLAGLGAAYGNFPLFLFKFCIKTTKIITGGVYSGNQMNHMALSPRHAGTLYGITNAAANTCGFLGKNHFFIFNAFPIKFEKKFAFNLKLVFVCLLILDKCN